MEADRTLVCSNANLLTAYIRSSPRVVIAADICLFPRYKITTPQLLD